MPTAASWLLSTWAKRSDAGEFPAMYMYEVLKPFG